MKGLIEIDYTSQLTNIKCPTLIMYGNNDNFSTLASQQKMKNDLPSATLTIYEGVGHALHWEKPGQVAKDIALFVQTNTDTVSAVNPSDYCYD
jgi:pimeloyl-ACP methyl ester carboxylesterase